MKPSKKCTLFIILTLILCTVKTTKSVFVCPPSSEILPCTCSIKKNVPFNEELVCSGSSIDLNTLEQLIEATRWANNISSPDGRLTISKLTLSDITMETLDLTPLVKTDFHSLHLYSNSRENTLKKRILTNYDNLSLFSQNQNNKKFAASTTTINSSKLDPNKFSTFWLEINWSEMTDTDLYQFLKFVDPQQIKQLTFDLNQIQLQDTNVLALIGGLTELEILVLGGDGLRKIGGGQFQKNNKLKLLSFLTNGMDGLGQSAFLFDPVPPTDNVTLDTPLLIVLQGNDLTDDGVHFENGLASLNRPIVVNLSNNKFDFISAANFEQFLLSDERHEMQMNGNIFVCDERMQWLRDGREMFEARVKDVWCSNDPGETIFTTRLLP